MKKRHEARPPSKTKPAAKMTKAPSTPKPRVAGTFSTPSPTPRVKRHDAMSGAEQRNSLSNPAGLKWAGANFN